MQDVQNIPNPDTNTNQENEEFNSHSDLHPETQEGGIETPGIEGDVSETIPASEVNDFPSEENSTEAEESDLL